ncbi:TPA: hypothetical protein ACH3X3_008309 [Trebouxia sp. C0006]
MVHTLYLSTCRRTLQVGHRVRRLTSYTQESQKGAQCTHGRTDTTVCSSCTGHAYGITDSTDSIQQRRPDQCPDGLLHVWEASVKSRTQGMGCPFCSGTKVCQHNTLARKAPQVARFWDAEKNPLSPDQVTASSRMKAHWKCSVCLHKWQAFVTSKAQAESGCPRCAKANGGRKADGTRQKHPTFAVAKHALLEQWDQDKNRENGNFPDNTTLQSQKLIWWHCKECPKGKVHRWQARADIRTGGKRVTGCPFCAGKMLCECNSLETVCPDIAADFDSQTNGVSAAEVTSSASAKYSWLSDEPEAKKRSVMQRTSWAKRKLKIAARRSKR